MKEMPNKEKKPEETEPFVTHRDIQEAERSIRRGQTEDPFFQMLERQFSKLTEEEYKDEVLRRRQEEEQNIRTKGPEQEIADHIKDWENFNEDYVLKNIDLDRVGINNYSEKEITAEFVDFLIGNALKVLSGNEILNNIKEIRILHITDDNRGVVISVKGENGKSLNLFFFGAPIFVLKEAAATDQVYP